MDLRKERTKRSIINAFIELRAKKPLEKISVKELSQAALINKATFYSHYRDIYDLSEQLEIEAIEMVLKSVPHPESIIENPKEGITELYAAIISQSRLFNILFTDIRASNFANRLEQGLKERIYILYPEYQNNLEWDILLTVLIQGCFHAFAQHSEEESIDKLADILGNINERVLHKK